MSIIGTWTWWRIPVSAAAVLIATAAAPSVAHVQWTRTNAVDAETIALYHADSQTTDVAVAAPPLTQSLGLTVVAGGPPLSYSTETAGTVFGPAALALPATQTLRSTDTVQNLAGDLTVEFWFKWNQGITSSTLEVGLQSGAKLLIARDISNANNDRLGISGTHGSFISAPGFTDWPSVGEEEASIDDWRHIAVTIHSAGIHYDPASAHDVYSTGTVARVFLNGHQVGMFPHTFDLGGLQVHDSSRIAVIMRGGGMTIDEITLWRRDWSGNGSAINPFSNGRGGSSKVEEWTEYNE